MKQLKLLSPDPPKRSKFNIGLVRGMLPIEPVFVKGTKVSGHMYMHFASKQFECPSCRKPITVKTGWSYGLHIRRAHCPSCKSLFCLTFEYTDDSWCNVCRSRQADCIKRFILFAEVIK